VQLAATGALVAAVEPHLHRAVLVASAATRSGGRAVAVRGDGTRPPLREDLDAVLVDAPCSGLGVLRRRPEARWRTLPADVDSAAALQLRLLRSGFGLLRPGGTLVYAVCTVTRTETHDVLRAFTVGEPRARSVPVHPEIPRATDEGDVLQLLPHVHGTDAMFVAAFERD
jgi:16S rRNA (cytosine967-C5)-methyltransferase